MAPRNRSNPLALAVLICLSERPMHPYEVATTLRQRHKDESVRLNYGSLYAVVESLERRGLIAPVRSHARAGFQSAPSTTSPRPGTVETHDWLTELIATPVRDFPPSRRRCRSYRRFLPPTWSRSCASAVSDSRSRSCRLRRRAKSWRRRGSGDCSGSRESSGQDPAPKPSTTS